MEQWEKLDKTSSLLDGSFEEMKAINADVAERRKHSIMISNAIASFLTNGPDTDSMLGVRFSTLREELERNGAKKYSQLQDFLTEMRKILNIARIHSEGGKTVPKSSEKRD